MKGVISDRKYVDSICKIGQMDDCCRYLACGKNGFECMKGTEHKAYLDGRVKAGTMNAKADGCEGWEVVRVIRN
jgi:hypothetical protein